MTINREADFEHRSQEDFLEATFDERIATPEAEIGADSQIEYEVSVEGGNSAAGEDPVEAARAQVEDSFASSVDSSDDTDSSKTTSIISPTPTSRPSQAETEGPGKSHVRRAEEKDLDRLADIDLMMFDKAYGQAAPEHSEVREMMARRLENVQGGGGMFVCEVDGEVNAFATYFRTNKPWEEFTTWEDTTNNGTLDGVVEPEGRYAYVVNMTVAPRASKVRGMQKVVANMFADAITEGLEYGYFVSRIPQLTQWMQENGIDYRTRTEEELDALAAEYIKVTSVSRKGKEEPYDYELRTYGRGGFEQGKLVKGGFSDEESLSYGVTFRADVPMANMPKPIRRMTAAGLKLAARSTKIAGKLF